jgi:hypothetical protein
MNVTGVEWRNPDSHEGRFPPKHPLRRSPKRADLEDDVIEIHDASGEESADELDRIEIEKTLTD